MKKPVDFDWYCKAKKDVINNAAYELIVSDGVVGNENVVNADMQQRRKND